MNLTKAIVIVLIFAAQLSMAQSREEAFGPADPVKSVHIFPNPATDFLTVKMEQPVVKKARIILQNIIGNQIEFESEVIDEYEVKIKVKDLPTGYYFLSVRDEQTNMRSAFKFLKR